MAVVRLIALIVALLTSLPAAAQTTTTSTTLPNTPVDTICAPTADPCVVTGHKPVNAESILDFGPRALVLSNGASLYLTTPGKMTINAGSLTLNATAALLGAADGIGKIVVTVDGDINLLSGSRIDVASAQPAESIIDLYAGGVAVVNGLLRADATDIYGDGGSIYVEAAGDVSVNENISARGGGQAGGGFISLASDDATVTVYQPIDATGGESDGGEIDVDSAGDTVLHGRMDVSATNGGLSGSGGTVSLTSDGSIQVLGPVVGRGQGSDPDLAGGGDGGEFDVDAAGAVTVTEQVTLTAGAGDGCGGIVDIQTDSGDISLTQPILAQGNGLYSCGGDVGISAGGNLSFKSVDVHSSDGGQVDVDSGGTLTLPGNIDADGGTATTGGSISVIAGTSALVSGNLHANIGFGDIYVEAACDLTLTRDALLSAKDNLGKNLGKNTLASGGQMSVAGTLMAGSENRLAYLDPSKPPLILPGASITPDPLIEISPAVLACPTTSTSTSSTTSTSTSSTSQTTMTTAVTTTSTTSTSITTTTRPPSCSPPDCNDDDPCTVDQCLGASGQCSHTQRQGFDAVTCRLEAIHAKALAAPADAIRSSKLRQKIVTKADKVRGLVDASRGGGRRGKASYRKAGRGLSALARMIGKGQARGKIDGAVGGELVSLAMSARSDLQQLSVP